MVKRFRSDPSVNVNWTKSQTTFLSTSIMLPQLWQLVRSTMCYFVNIAKDWSAYLLSAGRIQRLFWRKDRHCFFLNWIVIVDVRGFVVFSRPGFVGHLHDSMCFRHIKLPPFPQGLQIMADQGFANRSPLLVPVSAQGNPMSGIMK